MRSITNKLTGEKKLSTKQGSGSKVIRRTFSKELKIKKVKMYDQGLIGVSELSHQLEVSRASIYKWIKKYSLNYSTPMHVVMESKSEAKKVKLLKKELEDAYNSIGKKQMQLDFFSELIKIASDHYGEDITKKFSSNDSTHMGESERKGYKNE